MKIAYVLPVYWPSVGGCEIHTHELVLQMSASHDVRVITQMNSQEHKMEAERRGPFSSYLWFGATIWAPKRGPWSYSEGGARIHLLRVGGISRLWLYPLVRYHHRLPELSFNLLKAYFGRKIERKLKKVDILHCVHGGVSFLGHAAFDVARMKGIPFVYTPVLHLINEKWVETYKEHRRRGAHFREVPSLEISPRSWHDHYWLELSRRADALITMTEFEKEFFVRQGVPPERVFPVGVGPILAASHDGEAFRRKHDLVGKPVVLFLGRNHPLKGIRELLDATPLVWRTHPDAVFLFIGPREGDARAEFEKREDRRVLVLGEVSQEEKTSALEACDLLCLPSLHESFGGVFLEAWTFGKPVIGGDIPPVRELVADGKGGYLVMPEPHEIATCITKLLGDRELSRRMGEWGKEKTEREYTWERIANKIENVYERLASGELAQNPQRHEDGAR
jgi:glycosyltransferase involved in cell wall biosynthesis